ncbi:MAG: DNA polymerase III subunit delta [Patescibacteria group bacterium]|nr:DNA polymerase III subunit delta [Patescibacteria group bacterium]
MIIYIFGEDTFRSREYLGRTISEFKNKRDPQGYNTSVLDASVGAEKILSEITASPFLAEKRLIVLKNVLSSKDDALVSAFLEIYKNKKVPENNIIIFWQGEPVGKSKNVKELAEFLSKEKYSQEFPFFDGTKLAVWTREEIKKRGGTISQQALSYLSANVGKDMWFLNSIIDQLISFKNKDEIQLADAQVYLDEKADDNIFHMAEAMASGDKKSAFKLLSEQRRMGEDEGYIFGMVLRQFRILLELRDLFEREDNITSDEAAKRISLHPFVVKKSLPLARRYPMSKLKEIYNQLLDVDIKTKTGQGDRETLLDLFVGKLN